jgi:mRNA-degrading endonuclease toxin of MazEF toxin-antitoxin module
MINSVLQDFLFDIIEHTDTTNEKYYAFEKEVRAQSAALDARGAALCDAVLKKANQLMWLNLTLSRAALSDEKKNEVVKKKDALLTWFKTAYTEVDEHEKDTHS